MTYLLAVFAFPLLLAILSLGFGLLVERLAGWSIPALLLPAIGFAAIVGVSQLTTWIDPIAPATPWILLVVGLGGFAVTRRALLTRWRARRSGWWWGWSAGIVAYLIADMPVILAGRATFPGYLQDTTGSVQLMGAERIITHGQNWTATPPSGYALQLFGYFGTGYPSGSHSALGGLGRLVPVDYIWLYAPFLASMLALTALSLAWIARRAGLPAWSAAVSGCVAAVPALVYAYLLQGSIKEIALLPTLMVLGALVLLSREQLERGPRGVIPLAVVGAAGMGTIGLAFAPWFALTAIAVVVLGLPALGTDWPARARAVGWRLLWFIPATVLLAIPTIGPLKTSIDQARGVSNANAAAAADPGNLLRPLLDQQLFGVWLGPSHRVDPSEHMTQTYALIGIVAVGAMLGLVWLVRQRRWSLLVWIGISLLVWLVLTPRATTWTAAKLLVLFSPVVLLTAFVGAFGRLGSRRVEGLLLAVAIAGGVLASDGLLYHSTGLAPTTRFNELREIGQRYAGAVPTDPAGRPQQVTLTPDFDEYALYLLRDLAPDGPGNARRLVPWMLTDGSGIPYGHTVDLDQLPDRDVQESKLIVVRRGGSKSRPPSDYRRVFSGDFYDVWQRDDAAKAPLLHLGLGNPVQPSGTPSCRVVRRFAQQARAAGATKLTVAPRQPDALVNLTRAKLDTNVTLNPVFSPPMASWSGPGSLSATVNVPTAGAYRLWTQGTTGRRVQAFVDGRPAGSVQSQSGGDGNTLQFGEVTLTPGPHSIELVRGGGNLQPGNGDATNIGDIVLEPASAEAGALRTLPLSQWQSLCGGSFDWLEAS
ncbi:MAG TPA: hypothetical protein VGM91_08885 [Conexibacter sp.]|jgi:hypothetical protein